MRISNWIINKKKRALRLFQVAENLVLEESKEVNVINGQHLPKVFYLGNGKTGSASLKMGFGVTTAHWHHENHFETKYGIKTFSQTGLCLYDFISYLGRKHCFKPLIVESFRDPIARSISVISQRIHTGKFKCSNYYDFISYLTNERFMKSCQPYSIRWKEYFGIDLINDFDPVSGFYYRELDNVKLLFLRLENTSEWKKTIIDLGYNYNSNHQNVTESRGIWDIYNKVKTEYKPSRSTIELVYGNELVSKLYSEEELKEFRKR